MLADCCLVAELPYRLNMANSEGGEPRPPKRVKTEQKTEDEASLDIFRLQTFSNFKFVKVLNNNAQTKSIAVQGKFGTSESDAVVLLEKTPFTASTLPQIFSGDTTLEMDFQNDIYSQYMCLLPPNVNSTKGTVIYPATAKHLVKFTAQDLFFVHETPNDYESVTLPFIKEQSFSLQWVYNVLERQAEVERVIFEDCDPVTGFVLLPDLKWDQRQVENMYLVAICQSRDIKSLRSLDASHLPLLKNILLKGQETIKEKYGVPLDQLRIYVHYQPSYYHFHVHFTHLKFDAPGCGIGKAHLLQDMIDNIENIDSHYYQKKTMCCVFRQSDQLFTKFQSVLSNPKCGD